MLEAKQGVEKREAAEALADATSAKAKAATKGIARRARAAWDEAMLKARGPSGARRPRAAGEHVSVCGLIIADRSHHQITGDQMKFITICDYTGIIECAIFAQAYRRFGLETVRHPVVEREALVTPFDNGGLHTGSPAREQTSNCST